MTKQTNKLKTLLDKYKKYVFAGVGALVIIGCLICYNEYRQGTPGYVNSIAKKFCASKRNPVGCKCILRSLRMFADKKDFKDAMTFANEDDGDMLYSVFVKVRNYIGPSMERWIDSCESD